MKIFVYYLVILLMIPFLCYADPTQQPLLNSSDITYLGSFNVPRPGTGDSSNSFDWGGMGLAVSEDGNSIYVGGHVYNQTLGRVSIPNVGGTASLIQAPRSVPGSVGSDTTELSGALVYNGRLIVQKRIPYDNSGSGPTHAAGNLNISGFSSFRRMSNLPYAQFGNGYMGIIPPEWRSLLGGPAFAGNSVMSINSKCSNGPSFFVFNPDNVGSGSISSIPLMYFDYPNHMLGNPGSANDLFSRSDQYNAGMVFPSGTRSVLFWSRHGYGRPTYKQDDGCGGAQGEGARPYRRQITAFDANDLLAVRNGQKQPWEVRPYAWWTVPGPSDSCSKFSYSGLAYDPISRRVFATLYYKESPRIHVWQVSAGSTPPDDTTPPTPNPATWSSTPNATGMNSISMRVTTASDQSGVEYYFEEVSGNPGGSNSGWQNSTTYVDNGLVEETQYTYRVKSRDKSSNNNETGWSTQASATTDSPPVVDPRPKVPENFRKVG